MGDCSDHGYCGVDKTLRIIGGKWTMNILHHLFEDRKRFNELQRVMHPISPRTLSLRLQELEQDGIITKKVFAEVPLHVEYSLTKKGEALGDIFKQMAKWGDRAA